MAPVVTDEEVTAWLAGADEKGRVLPPRVVQALVAGYGKVGKEDDGAWSAKDVNGMDEEVYDEDAKDTWEAILESCVTDMHAPVKILPIHQLRFNTWISDHHKTTAEDDGSEDDGPKSSSSKAYVVGAAERADLDVQGMTAHTELRHLEFSIWSGKISTPADVKGGEYRQSPSHMAGGKNINPATCYSG